MRLDKTLHYSIGIVVPADKVSKDFEWDLANVAGGYTRTTGDGMWEGAHGPCSESVYVYKVYCERNSREAVDLAIIISNFARLLLAGGEKSVMTLEQDTAYFWVA